MTVSPTSSTRQALAGFIAPVWFASLVIVQGILQPDYSHVAMPISALEAWPLGWVQRLNFFVTAVLLATFVLSLHNAIQPARNGVTGIALLLVSCVGLLLVGLFPWISVNGVPTETPAHAVGAVVSFAAGSSGMIVISRRIKADLKWRDLATYVLVTGIAMAVLFIVVGFFSIGEGTPFHPWSGLLQRILVAIWFAGVIVLARRAQQTHH